MNERLSKWWPALPACLILYLGGASFVEKYPRAPDRPASRFTGARGPDSLLAIARHDAAPDSSRTAPGDDPFRPIHAPRPAAPAAPVVKGDPPVRRYVLKGTVGADVATIVNNHGQRVIVKAGDVLDSAEVVSIEANKVTLKDRGGKFELIQEK
jgi:hypothetical protein